MTHVSFGRALRATDGTEHNVLGRVLVSFANPAKHDALRTKATPRAAGEPLAVAPHPPMLNTKLSDE